MMLRKAFSLLTPLAAAALFFGFQTHSKAQVASAIAQIGHTAAPEMYLEMDTRYKSGRLDPNSWFFFFDGNFDCEGVCDSLVVTKDSDGTLHAVAKGYGIYNGLGAPVHIETHTTKSPGGASSFGIEITDDVTHLPLYSTGRNGGKLLELATVEGTVVVAPAEPKKTSAQKKK